MPHTRKNWHDKRAMSREPADYPDTIEDLLAQERERWPKPDRWREPPEPDTPAALRGGFLLPAGQNGER